MIKRLWVKLKPVAIYGIVGCLATAMNLGIFILCYQYLLIPNVVSNIIAWVISVFFAFIMNKLFVFESKDMSRGVFMRELCKFLLARLGTGLLDLLIMFIAVDVMEWNASIWKLISNIIVIIANYVLSKCVIFSKPLNDVVQK